VIQFRRTPWHHLRRTIGSKQPLARNQIAKCHRSQAAQRRQVHAVVGLRLGEMMLYTYDSGAAFSFAHCVRYVLHWVAYLTPVVLGVYCSPIL
jgi:hypothetical protein